MHVLPPHAKPAAAEVVSVGAVGVVGVAAAGAPPQAANAKNNGASVLNMSGPYTKSFRETTICASGTAHRRHSDDAHRDFTSRAWANGAGSAANGEESSAFSGKLVVDSVLHDPSRHEPLRQLGWDDEFVRAAIRRIVMDSESRFTEDRYWPIHLLDRQPGSSPEHVETTLYDGACGVAWALQYLQASGVATLSQTYRVELDRLLVRNRTSRRESASRDRASFLLGETPIRMMSYCGGAASAECEDALDALIAGNIDHPARELMYGSPGTLLAALFLYEHTGKRRWLDLFRLSAAKLWTQLEWSPQRLCSYWTQEFGGMQSTCLGAVHGFVATTLPLIRGRRLLDTEDWCAWERCIVDLVQRTADRIHGQVNWRPELHERDKPQKQLLQFCHGAPGFVVCLAGMPGTALDDLLLAAGETIWSAGPLSKGSNLCHGTGGNGYAFLKLFQRTRDSLWLDRARAFAMHGIAQAEQDAASYEQGRYSLWTGDLGLAIYLYDCLRGKPQFPTLDVFFATEVPLFSLAE